MKLSLATISLAVCWTPAAALHLPHHHGLDNVDLPPNHQSRKTCKDANAEAIRTSAGAPQPKMALGPVARAAPTPECGKEFGNRTYANTIQGHIKSLGEHTGDCHVNAKTCVKLACSLDGGISWCNDGAKPITRPCGDIARDAMRVMTRCKQGRRRQKKSWAHGEVRDSETSRVVVNKDSC